MKHIKYIVLLTAALLLCGPLKAEKAATLTEVLKPAAIFVDNDQLYVTEGTSVRIYSLKDFSYKTKFGKEGEGPREFKLNRMGFSPLFLDTQTDRLVISSQQKVSFFSKSGEFIREVKLAGGFGGGTSYQPIGNRFAYLGFATENQTSFISAAQVDHQFKKIKEIIRRKSSFQRGKKMNPFEQTMRIQTDTKCNHIMAYSNSWGVHIFDSEGKEKFTIIPEVEKIKFTGVHKKKMTNFYKTDPRMKRFWDRIQKIVEYPSHLPIIRLAMAVDCKIYVLTYHEKDGNTQLLVYDKNGKLTGKRFLPFIFKSFVEPYPYNIKNGNLYQLIENEDDEEWELHITKIN